MVPELSDVDPRILHAARALAAGYRIMLGLDGTSVQDAARQAYTPTGPSVEEIERRIRKRRGLPAPTDEEAERENMNHG